MCVLAVASVSLLPMSHTAAATAAATVASSALNLQWPPAVSARRANGGQRILAERKQQRQPLVARGNRGAAKRHG